jgi:transcriptional regulator with XRE-family HTH domain
MFQREIIDSRMEKQVENGIQRFRERLKMSQAELARRVGTNRQQIGRLEGSSATPRKLTKAWADRIAPHLGVTPAELMYPNLAKIDAGRALNVFEIALGGEIPEEPSISIRQDLMARLLPDASRHTLQLVMVDTDDMAKHLSRGDAVILDLEATIPTKPGVYALRIAGELQWRFLTPTTSGAILVRSDNPNIPEESAKPADLSIIGRARLKISTI